MSKCQHVKMLVTLVIVRYYQMIIIVYCRQNYVCKCEGVCIFVSMSSCICLCMTELL